MSLRYYFLPILIILLLQSCRKDKTIEEVNPTEEDSSETIVCDTIFPGDFFPAYPNSWWEYSMANGGTYLIEIDSHYYPVKEDGSCAPKWKNTGYAPWYIVSNGLIRYDGGALPSSPIWWSGDIYRNDTVGHKFYSTFGFGKCHLWPATSSGPNYRREIINTDTSLVLGNGQNYSNVLVINETFLSDSSVIYYDYFKSGVGLIKRDSVVPQVDSTKYEVFTLTDYYIGQ